MKLATKIAIAVTLVIAVLLGLDGFLRVQREITTFEKDTKRDHLSMGRATAAAINETWVSYGRSLAMDLIERIGKKTKRVSIKWIPYSELSTENSGTWSPDDIDRILNGIPVSTMRINGTGQKKMVTRFPIKPTGIQTGAIEISESLVNQSTHIRQTILRTAAITALVVFICALATLLLGRHLITRPIDQLVAQAKDIGGGNFSFRSPSNRRDEIAVLSLEMNTMAAKLTDAMDRIESETKAHLETLAQLRHADRLKTVGQLTSSVVHEVGTPLTVIAGRAKMIQSAEAEGEEAIECARIVVEQAERVTRTVRQILDFARASKSEKFTQNLVDIVRQMVELITPVAIKAGIYIDLHPCKELAYAHVDANLIRQVLANLIINAIQASKSGGRVSLFIDSEHRVHPENGNAPRDFWVISVNDMGCGIPEKNMDHIFESFYTTKTSGEGTGLGLAISKDIIREHGGFISVESTVGEGSTFHVCLPSEREHHA